MRERGTAEVGRERNQSSSDGSVSPIREPWLVRHRQLAEIVFFLLLTTVAGLSVGLAVVMQLQKRSDEQLQAALRSAAEVQERQERAIRKERADGYFQLGRVFSEFDSPRQTIGAYEKALTLFQELTAEEADSVDYLADLGKTLDNLGVQYSKAGRLNEAEDALRRTVDIRVELARRQPKNIQHITIQADTLAQLGQVLQRRGRWDDAAKAYRRGLESQSLALWTAQADKQPTVAEHQRKLAQCYVNLGNVYQHLRRWDEAKENFTKARELQEKLAREQAKSVERTESDADVPKK